MGASFPFPLNRKGLRNSSTDLAYERGQAYYEEGAVVRSTHRGGIHLAHVRGRGGNEYAVEVRVGKAQVFHASCDCAYGGGSEGRGLCKHVVAVILMILNGAADVTKARIGRGRARGSRASDAVRGALAPLRKEDLVELLVSLVADQRDLWDVVEARIAIHDGAARGRTAEAGAAAFARRVQSAIRMASTTHHEPAEAYKKERAAVKAIRETIQDAIADAGDATAALQALEAITEAYVKGFEEFDGSTGLPGDLFARLALAWVHALEHAKPPPAERSRLSVEVKKWHTELDKVWGISSFEPVVAAVSPR